MTNLFEQKLDKLKQRMESMTDEEKATLLQALDDFLEGRELPRFIEGGKGIFRVSSDGGKTFTDLGSGCIGDIRIAPKGEQP